MDMAIMEIIVWSVMEGLMASALYSITKQKEVNGLVVFGKMATMFMMFIGGIGTCSCLFRLILHV